MTDLSFSGPSLAQYIVRHRVGDGRRDHERAREEQEEHRKGGRGAPPPHPVLVELPPEKLDGHGGRLHLAGPHVFEDEVPGGRGVREQQPIVGK